jgi:hypothetical protein
MGITANNALLQTSVDYIVQEQAGVVAQERLTLNYDIDSGQTTALKYGDWVVVGAGSKGAKLAASTNDVEDILGIIPYLNSGIIDQQGYDDAFYTNVPVLKQGLVYAKCSGNIDIDSSVHLLATGIVTGASATGSIDISTIAKIVKKPAATTTGLVLLDINIL